MTIRNLWSLNVDEAILVDKLKKELGKEYQVFFPTNSQLRDIDLLSYNTTSRKIKSIQVKGSRTYDPKRSESKKYGIGKTSWFTINHDSIFRPKSEIDFFIFIFHILHVYDDTKSRSIKQKYLIIPIDDFRNLTRKKQARKDNKYDYFFWLESDNKRVLDFKNKAGREIEYTKYLNKFELLKY